MTIEFEADRIVDTPFCDRQSRSLILQLMSEKIVAFDYDDGWSSPMPRPKDDGQLKDDNQSPLLSLSEIKQTQADLETRGKAFQHTYEYYDAKYAEQERMKAYKGIRVTRTVPEGVDAEILANPFKFLNLPEGSTFGQT